MQRQQLIAMMNHRRVEGLGDFDELIGFARKYPYCSTFQVLKAIGLKELDNLDFSAQLNRAAVAIGDRSNLYDYIVKDQLLQRIEKSDEENAEPQQEKITKQEVLAVKPDAEEPAEREGNSSDIVGEGSALNADPMEAEIMREAIAHLGEMETERSFREFASGDSETNSDQTEPKLVDIGKSETEDSEPMSFGKWLMRKDNRKVQKSESEKALISKFIQESPQISPVKAQFFSPSQMGKLSLVDDESFVTETLANIYAHQGDFKKAARAYQNLSLKYPEKSIYFAALQKNAEDQLK